MALPFRSAASVLGGTGPSRAARKPVRHDGLKATAVCYNFDSHRPTNVRNVVTLASPLSIVSAHPRSLYLTVIEAFYDTFSILLQFVCNDFQNIRLSRSLQFIIYA